MSVADEIHEIRDLLASLCSRDDVQAQAVDAELGALALAAEEVEALAERMNKHLSENTPEGIEAAQAEFDCRAAAAD